MSEALWTIADQVQPIASQVTYTGVPCNWRDKIFVWKSHDPECQQEGYYSYWDSPIVDGHGTICGLFCTVLDSTYSVVCKRQTDTLQRIALASSCATVHAASRQIMQGISENNTDLPFCLLYLFDEHRNQLYLEDSSHAELCCDKYMKETISLDQPSTEFVSEVTAAFQTNSVQYFKLQEEHILDPNSKMCIQQCCMLPLAGRGVLVVGMYPLRHEEDYTHFLDTLANQIASTLEGVHGREEQEMRTRELQELDKAKTAFFTSISHEFRTPLTLMLGPLEDIMAQQSDSEPLKMIHRNTLRLLKLVNTLLDFAAISEQKRHPKFQLVHLDALTADIASMFRSKCQQVGLDFRVDLKPLSRPVPVDVDMWEKISINLISNAVKFTLSGSIAVSLKEEENKAIFSVSDTGSGVSESEIPHLFEPFHRVEGTPSRSYEGTGIGLALVSELVKLHNGSVNVVSQVGKGSTFAVSVPMEREVALIDSKEVVRSARALEWWFSDMPSVAPKLAASPQGAPKILVVDDNRDIREYIARLLSDKFNVLSATDGVEALEVVSKVLPDMILLDIMMPRMNGMEFLKRIRNNFETALVPVIVLTARAGEDSKCQGVGMGADDYLVKPFSGTYVCHSRLTLQAVELEARITAQLKLVEMRKQLNQRELQRMQAERANEAKNMFLAALSHELRTPLAPVMLLVEEIDMDPNLSRASKGLLAVIQRNLQLETRLMDDLLDLTRIQNGKLAVKLADANLHSLLHQTIETVKGALHEKDQPLQLDFKAQSFVANTDAVRVQQIFWNLLNNASKYSSTNTTIGVKTYNEGEMFCVAVSDQGIGIDPEDIDKIFEAFYQCSKPIPSQKYAGLGLGLPISKSLSQMLRGDLSAVSSGKGKGSTFILKLPYLPNVTSVSSSSSSAPSDTTENARSLRVILVEDDKATMAVMRRILGKTLGHTIQSATCYEEAIAIASEWPFDLLISDIGLPDKSGFEIVEYLRKNCPHPFTAIAVSGYGREEDIEKGKQCGFDRHLTKPIHINQLKNTILEVTMQHRK